LSVKEPNKRRKMDPQNKAGLQEQLALRGMKGRVSPMAKQTWTQVRGRRIWRTLTLRKSGGFGSSRKLPSFWGSAGMFVFEEMKLHTNLGVV